MIGRRAWAAALLVGLVAACSGSDDEASGTEKKPAGGCSLSQIVPLCECREGFDAEAPNHARECPPELADCCYQLTYTGGGNTCVCVQKELLQGLLCYQKAEFEAGRDEFSAAEVVPLCTGELVSR